MLAPRRHERVSSRVSPPSSTSGFDVAHFHFDSIIFRRGKGWNGEFIPDLLIYSLPKLLLLSGINV